jgi:hypothetical protein
MIMFWHDLRNGARMKKVSCVALLIMLLLAPTAWAQGQTNDLESFAAEIEQLRNLLKIGRHYQRQKGVVGARVRLPRL